MLSIGPTINASILLSVLLELPGKTFDSWRDHMKHGVKVRAQMGETSLQLVLAEHGFVPMQVAEPVRQDGLPISLRQG